MTDDRVCELGSLCSCSPPDRETCNFFHMPCPTIVKGRTTKKSDFVDRGLAQINQQNEKIRDSRADMKRRLPKKYRK